MISRFRPNCPIIAATLSEKAKRRLSLSWGVVPVKSNKCENTDELFEHAVVCAESTGLVSKGDLVVITGGAPMGMSGTTNIMKVHLVGHVLTSGTGVNSLQVTSNVCVANDIETVKHKFKGGDILVTNSVTQEMVSYLKTASGIVCEEEGMDNHGAILGMALDIPVITGANGATKILKSGTTVTLDAGRGIVTGDFTDNDGE